MKELQGKHAFITGGAGGVGLGMAKVFAKAGMAVSLADMRGQSLDEALKWFSDNGYRAQGITLDVTDRLRYAAAVDEAEAGLGPIQVLVNNAGVDVGKAPLWQFTDDDIDFITNVNIKGVINGIKLIVPRMLERGEPAHVVTTSSHCGLSAISGSSPYNLTKAAVATMMETVASDLQGTNVGVSTFFPGYVETDLIGTSAEVRPDDLKEKTTSVPRVLSQPDAPKPSPDEELAEPPANNKGAISAEESGAFVLRGIERGDLFIFTHPEFKDGLQKKHDAMMRAFPTDVPPDPERAYVYKYVIREVTYNPLYDKQEQR